MFRANDFDTSKPIPAREVKQLLNQNARNQPVNIVGVNGITVERRGGQFVIRQTGGGGGSATVRARWAPYSGA